MERTLLDEAYRKLKGSVYMDKTSPYICYDIAKYESGDFENKMQAILDAVNDGEKWDDFERKILRSIRAFTFPKKIDEDKNGMQKPIVISNVCSDGVKIETYNNFIDISIEGHIIGVLWILLVGYRIDNELTENCYGKRLCDKLVFSDRRVSESPNLFKPYYSQYESWRNHGLNNAQSVVNKDNQSVIITMLDLTRYFYSINYTKDKYERITDVGEEEQETQRINNLVYKILQRYSILLGESKKVVLPIGFLPSNILSNAYLHEFDIRVINSKNTTYYGRYVDDMIVVSRIEPYSRLNSRITKNGVSEISSYMLKLLEEEKLIECSNNELISLVGYEGLDIKKEKIRFFYVDKNGYDTIIEKIKSDIAHNTSEFDFVPEDSLSEFQEDILQFTRDDTVNKLRALNSVSIDKYALSKAIGKNVKLSQYAEEKAINSFIKSIDQILNHREIISNYNQWEGVLNYYILNEKWKKITVFTGRIISALEELDENTSKVGEYEYLHNDGVYSVGDSLVKYYIACLTRSLSIVWGKKISEVIESVSSLMMEMEEYITFQDEISIKNINNMRKHYCNSRMINRNLIPIAIEECMSAFSPNDKTEKVVCFYRLNEYFLSRGRNRYSIENEKYKPYISSPFDILYTALMRLIKHNSEKLYDDNNWLDFVCDEYAKNFSNANKSYLRDYIMAEPYGDGGDIIITDKTSEDKDRKGKYRIAVANVKMRECDFEDILDDKKRNISERCREISKIVNEAIRYKSDILIFPEAYIPLTFLPVIQEKVAKHDMVIIGGIEHIKRGKFVYNLTTTLIPVVNEKMRYTIPFFHPKVYYSPHEEEKITKHNCVPVRGNGHTLFAWNDLSFVTFCCYELTSIEERSKFKREADIVFGVEWNKDTKYFSNIIESLSRDRCCFCAQSNMSKYGDSRIVQPTKNVTMNIARVKGGINGTVIVDEIDVDALRKHIKSPSDEDDFKPLPAGY